MNENNKNTQNDYEYVDPFHNPAYKEIRRYINEGNIAAAEAELFKINSADRFAEWNFLYGGVLIKKGQYIDAQMYIDKACSMDPDNMEYQNTQNELSKRANQYGSNNPDIAQSCACSCCDICAGMMCMDCLCSCMGCH